MGGKAPSWLGREPHLRLLGRPHRTFVQPCNLLAMEVASGLAKPNFVSSAQPCQEGRRGALRERSRDQFLHKLTAWAVFADRMGSDAELRGLRYGEALSCTTNTCVYYYTLDGMRSMMKFKSWLSVAADSATR